MKKTWIWIVMVAVAIAAVVAVLMQRRAAAPANPTIGAIVFLTGPQSILGSEVQNAINLAVEEVNKSGGIKGAPLRVVYEDSKDQPRDAITAFRRLADRDLPAIIVTGDVVSLNLAPFAVEQKLPLVATVAAGPGIAKRDWVFRVFHQGTHQGERMARYAASDLKLRRVAGLRINNDFGATSFDAFQKAFVSAGGEVVAADTFGVADRDVRNQIAKLRAANPDGIFITGFGDGYGAAIKQIRESGYTGMLMTDASLGIPFFKQQTTPANEGSYLVAPEYDEYSTAPKAAQFNQRWRAAYKFDPSFVGAFAYDSLGVIAAVMREGATTPDEVRRGLQTLQNYQGVIGPMRFSADGDVEFPLVIKKIVDGKPVVVAR
jgi:branched-chain amino acid transport system substrate-binding protein